MSDRANEDGSPLASLSTISGGAALFFIGRGFRKMVNLGTNLILTRSLGAGSYGLFAYMTTLFALFRVFTELGSVNSLLQYIPKYEDQPRKQHAVLTLAYLTSLVGSVLVAAVVFVVAPLISRLTLSEPLFVDVLRIGALVLPFNTLANVTYSTFKSVERMDYNVFTSSVIQPLLRLAFVGGAVALGYAVVGVVAAVVVSGILALSVAFAVLARRTSLVRVARPSIEEAKEYYDYSIPLTFTRLGSFLYNRVDIIMIGVFLTGSAVGIYRVSMMLAGILALPTAGFNQLFPPVASRLHHKGRPNELAAVYTTVTRWTFTISLLPALGLVLYADEILRVFGQEFTTGATILGLFVLAQLTHSAVGPSGYLLMMTEHQYVTSANQVVSGVVNAALNYLLILEFGFVGAAVATAAVLATINLVRVGQVWYFEGMFPYDRKFLKPIGAGG